MKRYIKIGAVFALIALLSSAFSCGDAYRDDVASRVLGEAMIGAIGDAQEEYYTAGDDTYAVYFAENDAYAAVEDCAIIYHSDGTHVDQAGVFRVRAGEDIGAVREMVQTYVNGQLSYLRSFAANYNPAQMAKLDRARVQILGQYVIFTILDAQDEAAALACIRDSIRA